MADFLRQVVVVTGSNVTAINADTGQYLWNALTDGQIQGAPVAIDNFVFVGSLASEIASYDVNYQGSAGSGKPSWLNAATSRDKFVVGEANCICFDLSVCMCIIFVATETTHHLIGGLRWSCWDFAQQN